MNTKIISITSVLAVCVMLAGCNGVNISKQDLGIAGGAVAGGIIGSAVTGSSTVGTIVGAAGGAFAGKAIADHYQ